MKGKRPTTEQKIRRLREADGGKCIVEVSKECARSLTSSEVTFHRWKRPFGQLEVNEARRMKELERESAELKKMLADSLLKNRGLEAVNAKNGKSRTQASDGRLRGGRRAVLLADGVPAPQTGTLELPVSDATADERARPFSHAAARTLAQVSALRVRSPPRAQPPGALHFSFSKCLFPLSPPAWWINNLSVICPWPSSPHFQF